MAHRPSPADAALTLRPARADWLKLALLVAAFVATFWHLLAFLPPLGSLVWAWRYKLDWSHGPLIPVFSAYLVYLRWDRLQRCPPRHTWLGLLLLLFGLALYAWSLVGLLFAFTQPLAMMLTLLGVLIFTRGLPALRWLWLPWLYLFFAIPMPQPVYTAWTDPLRRIAAEVAAAVLSQFPGLDISRVGSNLEYTYRGSTGLIGVADACSGMRSTMTLCAVGVAVACMSERPVWQRLVLVAACIPIATFCNFIRVTVTCWLHIFVDPKYATGQYHMMLGLAIILLAFAIFQGLGWLLEHLLEDTAEPETASAD
jgi:exosortase